MIAGILTGNGAVISLEHLVMVVFGAAGAALIWGRLGKLRDEVGRRFSHLEDRVEVLEGDEVER